MILSRQVYEDLRAEIIASKAALDAMTTVNAQLTAQIEWMRAWLTKSEFERAQLIKKYLGVEMPVPAFEPAAPEADMNQVPLTFEDVGDEEAAKLGIAWNADGTLRYNSKA